MPRVLASKPLIMKLTTKPTGVAACVLFAIIYGTADLAADPGTALGTFMEPTQHSSNPLLDLDFQDADHNPPGIAVTSFAPFFDGFDLYPAFKWGQAENPGELESFFYYDAPGSFDTSANFSVGDLVYFNGSSALNTGVRFVDLELTLNVNSIDNTYKFTLEILNTENNVPTGTPEEIQAIIDNNADAVRFLNPTPTVPLNTGTETLYLTFGFDLATGDGFISEGGNKLNVREGGSASASIKAFVSATPPNNNVPDAGSTLALLGSAFASLSFLRRYRR